MSKPYEIEKLLKENINFDDDPSPVLMKLVLKISQMIDQAYADGVKSVTTLKQLESNREAPTAKATE